MISLTPSAKQYLQQSLAQASNNPCGIRIGLRDAGCSGYAYTIDFTNTTTDADAVYSFDNLNIIIAKEHLAALEGTELDYVTSGINSLLQFNNPNVINQCGCGESFQFKDK